MITTIESIQFNTYYLLRSNVFVGNIQIVIIDVISFVMFVVVVFFYI